MRVSDKTRTRGEGNIQLIVGLALFIVVGVACFKIVPLHIKGNDVLDAMNEAANFGTLKATEKLQYEIWDRAAKAGVPLDMKDIRVYKRGSMIIVEAKYRMETNVFGYKYVYDFDKKVEKPTF